MTSEPCRHERVDAITSFVTQTKALVEALHERDQARAQIERVRALIDKWDADGMPAWPTAEIRAAMVATEGDAP